MFLLICFVTEDMDIMRAMNLVLLSLNYIRLHSKHPNPREIYNQKLMAQGVVESSIVKEMTKQFKNLLEQDLDEARKEETTSMTRFTEKEWAHIKKAEASDFDSSPETGISREKLTQIARALYTAPEGHQFYKKALRLLKDREKI